MKYELYTFKFSRKDGETPRLNKCKKGLTGQAKRRIQNPEYRSQNRCSLLFEDKNGIYLPKCSIWMDNKHLCLS
jgi:hypothetical protein